jgi:alcohol dehydrogenase (NADP+)
VEAVRYGYRHIDCAYIYQNEAIVGRALRHLFDEGTVRRDELWVTSKLWNASHRREQAIPAVRKSLEWLGLDYLDLYLIHWPVALKAGTLFPESPADFVPPEEIPLAQTWQGMEDCLREGFTRHIGVSNFTAGKLSALLETCRIRPENNQVELNPYLQQPALVEYCFEQRIGVTAYSPLGKGNVARRNDLNLFEDPVIRAIAAKQGCTVSQVMLKWAIDKGIAVIPKSVTPERIRENYDAIRVALTTDDTAAIDRLDRHNRISFGGLWLVEGSPYTYRSLWEEDESL